MRHLLSYLVFVGVPLAGLLSILRLGQGLSAPIAVHGAYAVQPMAAPGLLCHRYLLTGGDSTLSLAQSGRQLTATLGPASDVSLKGSLSGADISLEGVITPGSTPRHVACPLGDTLRVTGRVYRGNALKRVNARLWSGAGVEGGAIRFVAARPRHYEGQRRP